MVSGGMNHEDEDRRRIKICEPMSGGKCGRSERLESNR
jgi:hypothetical protein